MWFLLDRAQGVLVIPLFSPAKSMWCGSPPHILRKTEMQISWFILRVYKFKSDETEVPSSLVCRGLCPCSFYLRADSKFCALDAAAVVLPVQLAVYKFIALVSSAESKTAGKAAMHWRVERPRLLVESRVGAASPPT